MKTLSTYFRHVDDPNHDGQGITGNTPLYRVPPPFSVIWDIPTEEFHLCKEGITKLLVKRLLEDSKAKTAKKIKAEWSEIYENTRVFSETARRTRQISTSQMKGSEFGVLLFSAFPSLVVILERYKTGHW